MLEEKTHISRPLAISIVATCSFLMGLIGTSAGAILGFFLLRPLNVSTSFIVRSISTFLTLFWVVGGPILVYSSYNLFKMKKWAAQTVAAVILFDLIASPLYITISQSSLDAMDVLAWSIDIITLLLLASAWNTKFVR